MANGLRIPDTPIVVDYWNSHHLPPRCLHFLSHVHAGRCNVSLYTSRVVLSRQGLSNVLGHLSVLCLYRGLYTWIWYVARAIKMRRCFARKAASLPAPCRPHRGPIQCVEGANLLHGCHQETAPMESIFGPSINSELYPSSFNN